jgi:hypothetical protein
MTGLLPRRASGRGILSAAGEGVVLAADSFCDGARKVASIHPLYRRIAAEDELFTRCDQEWVTLENSHRAKAGLAVAL